MSMIPGPGTKITQAVQPKAKTKQANKKEL